MPSVAPEVVTVRYANAQNAVNGNQETTGRNAQKNQNSDGGKNGGTFGAEKDTKVIHKRRILIKLKTKMGYLEVSNLKNNITLPIKTRENLLEPMNIKIVKVKKFLSEKIIL